MRRRKQLRDGRRVVVGGISLAPGHHELRIALPGLRDVAVRVIVGARRGPRAILVGGIASTDLLGLATVDRLMSAIDATALRGSLVTIPRISESESSIA